MPEKQGNDATPSSKGTIYQICVGVQKCYEMREGQKVLIEREGDVSIEGDQQVETKQYSDVLTDSHLNFWNTLVNWIAEGFDDEKYSSLILHTTQDFGATTRLKQWNESNTSERIGILETIAKAGESRLKTAISKDPSAKIPKSLRLQRAALTTGKRAKLESVVSKYYIESATDRLPDTHRSICEVYLKGIENQSDFLNSLIGFVSHAEAQEDKEWEVTYDEFNAKVSDLIRVYKKNSYAFPRKHFDKGHASPPENVDQHLGYRFVERIREIDHHDVVYDAIRDYLGAVQSLNEDFKHHFVSRERTNAFVDDLISLFKTKHRIECRRTNPTDLDAQNFYDAFMAEESRDFSGFERPHRGFKNGLLHTQIDDETKVLQWKLEKQ
ncbi:MAG: hypothetical protein ABW168_18180 [Sedimenticola sp.]